MTSPQELSIRVDYGLTEKILAGLAATAKAIAGGDKIAAAIELSALGAITEIQRSADAAHRTHGWEPEIIYITIQLSAGDQWETE